MTRRPFGWMLLALALVAVCVPQPSHAEEKATDQIRISYLEPRNKAHAPILERLRARRVLEDLRDFLGALKLPKPLFIRTAGCGSQNATYNRDNQTITICYELVSWIHALVPADTSQHGIAREDAIVGAFVDILLHEIAHAVIHLFNLPVLGREEDAADQLAALIMLQFGEDVARRTITGTALLFQADAAQRQAARKKWESAKDAASRLTEFASQHGLPEQRYFNVLCIAYGRHRKQFADFINRGELPVDRARFCKEEYEQIAHAYHALLEPHVDQARLKEIMSREWLPPSGRK